MPSSGAPCLPVRSFQLTLGRRGGETHVGEFDTVGSTSLLHCSLHLIDPFGRSKASDITVSLDERFIQRKRRVELKRLEFKPVLSSERQAGAKKGRDALEVVVETFVFS